MSDPALAAAAAEKVMLVVMAAWKRSRSGVKRTQRGDEHGTAVDGDMHMPAHADAEKGRDG